MIRLVTFCARCHAPFRVEFAQSLCECQKGVRRRCESELPVRFEPLPLLVQVQAQRPRPAGARVQCLATRQHKRKSRYAFNALVRRRHQEINPRLGHVQRDRAEAAHRVHDKRPARLARDTANRLDRIQHAGGCLAVHQRDVRDIRVLAKELAHGVRVNRLVFRNAHGFAGDAVAGGNTDHAFTVGAIHRNKQFPIRRNRAR